MLQVAQRAGEIAKELGLISKADQIDTTPTNSTGGNWMNLNLFNRNASDSSNSSWYSSDNNDSTEDKQAAAALQRYQQLDLIEDEKAASPALSFGNITGAAAEVTNQSSMLVSKHNASDIVRTQSSALNASEIDRVRSPAHNASEIDGVRSPAHNASEIDRTRPLSRAERVGSKQQLVLL